MLVLFRSVRATLVGEGFDLSVDVADRLLAFSRVRSTSHDDALAKLDALGAGTPLFEEGRGELRELLGRLKAMGVPESRYGINLSIARGLDYYTGMVYETTLDAWRSEEHTSELQSLMRSSYAVF